MTPESQVPGTAVRDTPTFGVPVIVGVGVAVWSPGATGSVALLAWLTVSKVGLVLVTWNAMAVPSSVGVGVNVVPVAPAIGAPSANHW